MGVSTRVPRTRSRTGCFTCRKRKKKCDELLYPICQNCQEKHLVCKWPLKKHEMHKKLEEVKYIGYEDKTLKSEVGSSVGSVVGDAHKHKINTEDQQSENKAVQKPEIPLDVAVLIDNISDSANDLLSMEEIDNIAFKSDILDHQASYNPLHGILGQTHQPIDLSGGLARHIDNYKSHNVIRRPTDPNIDYPYRVSKKDMEKKKHNYFLERIAMQQDCVDSDEEELDIPSKGPFEIHLLLESDYILNDENTDNQENDTRTRSPLPKSGSQQETPKLGVLPYRLKPSASGLFSIDSPLPH